MDLVTGIFSNKPLLWLASLLVGGLSGAAGTLFYKKIFKTRFLAAVENEQFKKDRAEIEEAIFAGITKPDLEISDIADATSLSQARISSVTRKFSRESFTKHVIRLRIELAKERLRSSHSTEQSIAESCGFSNVSQMTKCFKWFYKTSPTKYRQTNHVM